MEDMVDCGRLVSRLKGAPNRELFCIWAEGSRIWD